MPPPSLLTLLQSSSWRHLLALMAAHGLAVRADDRKASLVQTLHHHLLQPDNLQAALARLGPPARPALAALIAADGRLPAPTFSARFGLIRSPWPQETNAQPWLAPASPAAALYHLGLVFLDPPKPKPGESQHIVLPADLLTRLPPFLQPAGLAAPALLRPRPGHSPDLSWHLAIFLATLAAAPVHPREGRWLPPHILPLLAQRLGLEPPAAEPLRSERRLPYLAFLHYLAEAAGFIAAGQRFDLSPLAWRWLDAGPADRWQTLWQTWLSASPALALPYGFPWAALSPAARAVLADQLPPAADGRPHPLAAFIENLRLGDARGLFDQPWGEDEDAVAALLAGPLFWLGVIDLYDDPGGPAFDLTPAGAWLLRRPGHGPPASPPASLCQVDPADNTRLFVAPATSPTHLVRLAPFCTWPSPAPHLDRQTLILDPDAVASAVAAGQPLSTLLLALHHALGRASSHRLVGKLRQWARKGQDVRLHQLAILETTSPDLMADLRRRKLIRRHLGDALSPTRSIANPAALPALRQHLASLGWHLAAEPPPSDRSPSDPPPAAPVGLSSSQAALLWLAGQVYQGLGEHIALPFPLPAALLDDLAAALTLEQQEAADFWAGQVADALTSALAGYLGHPAWLDDAPAFEALPAIEAALAAGHDLILTYHSPAREQKLVRRVTPYWLEQRQDTYYLIAYCHLRNDERVFRLDRILACHPAAAEATSAA